MSCPSSIRRRDSNPRPLERESTPITTRPVLPPNLITFNIESQEGRTKYFLTLGNGCGTVARVVASYILANQTAFIFH